MQDKEARNQIKELRQEIAGLRQQITELKSAVYFNYPLPISKPNVSVKEVIEVLLQMSGLEITYIDPARTPGWSITAKEKHS